MFVITWKEQGGDDWMVIPVLYRDKEAAKADAQQRKSVGTVDVAVAALDRMEDWENISLD